MKTTVIKRTVAIGGRKTSVSLEAEFWDGLRQIATREGIATSALLAQIERTRGSSNLSSLQRIDPSLRFPAGHDERLDRRKRA